MFTVNINYIKMKTTVEISSMETNKKERTRIKRVEPDEQKIKKILVPVDFSDISDYAAFSAATIANVFNSKLYLIHVLDYHKTSYSVEAFTSNSILPIAEIEVEFYGKLNDLRLLIEKQSGINSRMYVTEGVIYDEILKFAHENNIDMIIMGTHGLSGYKEFFSGSNAEKVIKHSDIPVLTMKKEEMFSDFRHILLPIDNSPHSREKVNTAIDIAEAYGSQIHLLGLPDSKDDAELKTISIKIESVERVLENNNIPFETHIIDDEKYLAKAALDYGRKYDCDLIIINSGHESKVNGDVPDMFAHQIINNSKIPVLSVKPTEDSYIIAAPGFGIS